MLPCTIRLHPSSKEEFQTLWLADVFLLRGRSGSLPAALLFSVATPLIVLVWPVKTGQTVRNLKWQFLANKNQSWIQKKTKKTKFLCRYLCVWENASTCKFVSRIDALATMVKNTGFYSAFPPCSRILLKLYR